VPLSDSLREELKSFVLDDGGSLWVMFRADIKVSTNNQMRTDPSFLAKLASVSAAEFESVWDYADDEFFGGLGISAITRRKLSDGGEVVYVGTGIDPELLVPLATATRRMRLHSFGQ